MLRSFALVLSGSLLVLSPSLAQGLPQSLPTLSEADQARATRDMLAQIKAAVNKNSGDRVAMYKTISKRLFGCAVLYGVFSKSPELEPSYRAWYSASEKIFLNAVQPIYPDHSSLEAMKRDFANVNSEIPKPEQKMEVVRFLRNCKDLSDPDPAAVYNAVQELKMISTPRQ